MSSTLNVEYMPDDEILIKRAEILRLCIENGYQYEVTGDKSNIITIKIPTYKYIDPTMAGVV